jgi:hypothetical protein
MSLGKKLKIAEHAESPAHLLSKLLASAAEEWIHESISLLWWGLCTMPPPSRYVEKQKCMLLISHCYFVPTVHVYVIYQRITLLPWKRGFALRAS